jgi:hypothetical protein
LRAELLMVLRRSPGLNTRHIRRVGPSGIHHVQIPWSEPLILELPRLVPSLETVRVRPENVISPLSVKRNAALL